MVDKNDWRLTGQEEYLEGADLIQTSTIEYANNYAGKASLHEHCEFCMKPINFESKEIYYTTTDYYRWICEKCFNDFQDMFHWRIDKKE